MTRKDYKLIGEAINTAWKRDDESMLYAVIQELSSAFKRDNPRFNEEKFRKACGVE